MKIFLTLMVLLAPIYTNAQSIVETHFSPSDGVNLHVGIYSPVEQPKMDLIYLPGYADVFSNHEDLFKKLTDNGIRVISFNYPNHGKTEVNFWNDLNLTTFTRLASYVDFVEKKTRQDRKRPLALLGWSTGGLLTTRILQGLGNLSIKRKITHAVLITPGVSVYTCVGEKLCYISNKTLTHDKSLWNRPIHPLTPLTRPKFGAGLMINANKAWKSTLPQSVKTMVLVAGNKADKYAKTKNIKKWVRKQRSSFYKSITALQCTGARHELHNETTQFGGTLTRENIQSFLLNKTVKSSSVCRRF
ncbi:MAG: alpha/beta fold hydrolase [Bacteriovoracaceae bacterium]|nr:alpha/beta fold hydrolase [Bacteriovoracaceae bacterium]